jgi:diguanylate cyclase (GGDEF)-like protein
VGAEILIVAAEAQIRRSLTRICRLVDCQVGLAETHAQALTELSQAPITLCLLGLDSAQPLLETLSFLRQARKNDPLLELIVLSAADAWLPEESRSELGLCALLREPWPEDRTVAAIIHGAIRHNQLRRRHEALRRLWHEGLGQLQTCSQALGSLSDIREMLATLVRSLVSTDQIDAAGAIFSHGADPGGSSWVVLASQTGLSAPESSTLTRLLVTAASQMGASSEPEIVLLPPQPLSETTKLRGDAGEQALHCTGALGLSDGSCVALVIAGWRQGICDDDLQPLLSTFGALAQSAFEQRATLATARDQASRDSLTGLYDYAHFMRLLAREIERAADDGTNLVVMMLDVDSAHGLKQVNDRFGHQAGDRLLRGIADLLRDHVRPGDILSRYGGDEFLILAPHTEPGAAFDLAERLIQIVGETEFVIEPHVQTHISLSVGLAVASESGGTPDDLVAKADRGLYLAKAKGGSCIGVID